MTVAKITIIAGVGKDMEETVRLNIWWECIMVHFGKCLPALQRVKHKVIRHRNFTPRHTLQRNENVPTWVSIEALMHSSKKRKKYKCPLVMNE